MYDPHDDEPTGLLHLTRHVKMIDDPAHPANRLPSVRRDTPEPDDLMALFCDVAAPDPTPAPILLRRAETDGERVLLARDIKRYERLLAHARERLAALEPDRADADRAHGNALHIGAA